MNNPFENIRKIRKHLLGEIQELNAEQLNKVPPGFNNNIIWNLAHLVAAQQGLCYLRSGLEPVADLSFVQSYLPGTRPEKYLEEKEIETIKELLISTTGRFETDYQNKIFSNYESVATRYDVTLSTIDDVLQFIPFHEGIHTGYIWALKRAIKIETQG